MSIYQKVVTANVVAGSWSDNISIPCGGRNGMIAAVSASAGTKFDFAVIDKDDFEPAGDVAIVGKYYDFSPFILKGTVTLSIANCTADEVVSIKIMLEE